MTYRGDLHFTLAVARSRKKEENNKMASLKELPYPVVNSVLEYLPVVDILEMAKVFPDWKINALTLLKYVRIDPSTPYGGSWRLYNEGAVNDDKIATDILAFIDDLVEVTDNMEHFYLCTNLIHSSGIIKLLSTQKAIKSLVVSYKRYRRKEDPPEAATEVGDALVQGIIKHEKSLEKIDLGVEEYSYSFEALANAFKDRQTCFPNLKSMELVSSTACAYSSYDSDKGFKEREFQQAQIMFSKMFVGAHIQELNFKPKLEMVFYDGKEVFWQARYVQMMLQYFTNGAFSNLRKINIDSLNTRGILGEFSDADAQLLIENCPHISHIDSDVLFFDKDSYRYPVQDEKPLIKIIKHYGPQIVYLNCYTSTNIVNSISENCPHLEAITLVDDFNDGLTDSSLMALSCLKNLKKLKLFLHRVEITPAAVIEFLDKNISKLQNLSIEFLDTVSVPNILKYIGLNGKNLQKIQISFMYKEEDEFYKAMMEGLLQMLNGCREVRSLIFIADRETNVHSANEETRHAFLESCTNLLISGFKNLKYLQIRAGYCFEKEQMESLRKSKPNCRIEFSGRIDK